MKPKTAMVQGCFRRTQLVLFCKIALINILKHDGEDHSVSICFGGSMVFCFQISNRLKVTAFSACCFENLPAFVHGTAAALLRQERLFPEFFHMELKQKCCFVSEPIK